MNEVLKNAIKTFGTDMQLNIAIEELSELIKELCKYKRGEGKQLNIAEEIADVKIILKELEIIFDNAAMVDVWENVKIERLKERTQNASFNKK